MTELPVTTWGDPCRPNCGESITVTSNVDSTANHYPDAYYWLKTAVAGLANGIDVGALGTGIIKSTSGVPSLAIAGTDFPGLASLNTFTKQNTFSGTDGIVVCNSGTISTIYPLQLTAVASSDFGISVINTSTGSAELMLRNVATSSKRPEVRFFSSATEKGFIGMVSTSSDTGNVAGDIIVKALSTGAIALHVAGFTSGGSNKAFEVRTTGRTYCYNGLTVTSPGDIVSDTINGITISGSGGPIVTLSGNLTIHGGNADIGASFTTAGAVTFDGIVSTPAGGFTIGTHGVILRTLEATDCYLPSGGKLVSTKKIKTSVTTTATLVPKFSDDIVIVTSLSDNISISNPTAQDAISAPEDGQEMIFRITVAGSTKTITWGGSKYTDKGATKPTSGTASTTFYIRNIYNAATDKWDCVSSVSAL